MEYLRVAEKMFSAEGLADPGQYRWQRALLSIGDYLLPSRRNHSFLRNASTTPASWKRLLSGSGSHGSKPRSFLKELWDRLNLDRDLAQQLDNIIDKAQPPEPWREVIVQYPEAFKYCRRQNFRWTDSGTRYLLKKSQLNGRHVELFTYCLFKRIKRHERFFTVLRPSYEEVTDTQSEPHLELGLNCQDVEVTFSVYNEGEGYRIRLANKACIKIANLGNLLKTTGYSETEEFFEKWSSRSDIEAHLQELDSALNSRFDNAVADG